MKLSCLQKNLIQGITTVEKAIAKNSTLPILNNILLEVDKGRLKFSATNLEIAIISWVGAKILKPGELTIPAKILSNFINSLPSKKIDLESKANSLEIKCENFKVNIKGLTAKDFPLIPRIKKDPITRVSSPNLKRGLAQVISSAAISDSRPELSGILFKIEGQELKLVATDSYRLAEKKIFLKEKPKEDVSIIIPLRAAYELIRILGDQEEEVSLSLGENQSLFDVNKSQLISRLIDGKFPDYEKIIPEKFKGSAVINLAEFINGAKIASLFSGQVDDIELGFTKTKLELKSQSAEVGSNISKINSKLKGASVNKIILNHKYLLDGLQNILTDEIKISFNDVRTPILIEPFSEAKRPKDRGFLYVIMPIKNQ